VIETLPTSVTELTALVHQLIGQVKSLTTENVQLRQQVVSLSKRVVELELKLKKSKIDPPPKVKPNIPDNDDPKLKRKERVKSYVRYRSVPDEIVIHAYSHCPDCGTPVTGDSLAYDREIIDLPPVKPIVTLHKVLKRFCTHCHTWVTPDVDFSSLALGQSRFGVGIMSIAATLRERGRLPVRVIRQLFSSLFNLDVSIGEIITSSHKIAAKGKDLYQGLHQALLTSPSVHADETSHRENGKNGYAWNFTTPKIRYYVYRLSRSGTVVDEVLGEEFEGVLTTDFYAAYNHIDSPHQRCWSHLLRKLHDLVTIYAGTKEVKELEIIEAKINAIYQQARKVQKQENLTLTERHQERRRLESKLLRFVKPYLKQKSHPFHILAKRIDYYLDELFTFVLDQQLEATNNVAERAVRHQVIKRKISGGTRSKKGSQTQEVITTIFSTWDLNNLNPIEECKKLLTQPNYAANFIQEL
jgi:transposase